MYSGTVLSKCTLLPPLLLPQLFNLHLQGPQSFLVGLLLLLVLPHLLFKLLLEQSQLPVGHLDERKTSVDRFLCTLLHKVMMTRQGLLDLWFIIFLCQYLKWVQIDRL